MSDDDDDRSIVEALSALGWVEEAKEEKVLDAEEGTLKEQLDLFKKQNEKLNEEIIRISKENNALLREIDEIRDNQQDTTEKDAQIQALEAKILELSNDNRPSELEKLANILKERENDIKDKQQYIQKVFGTISNKENELAELTQLNDVLKSKIIQLSEEIQELATQIETHEREKAENEQEKEETKQMENQLEEKDAKIKELNEQIEYLSNTIENDTIPKSKFEKLNILIEKKDEIITEKEKRIFDIQTILNQSNKKNNELDQQLETFNLVRIDRDKKEERNKELVLEIERLNQELIKLKELNIDSNNLAEEIPRLKKQLKEAEKIESGLLDDLQIEKDNVLKWEIRYESKLKDIEGSKDGNTRKLKLEIKKLRKEKEDALDALRKQKDSEIVELKKRIKIMRRDLS